MDIKKPQQKNPKLTDAERHKRFVETAQKVEASEKTEDFDNAFKKLSSSRKPSPSKVKPS
jgi:hypothetical protein